MYLNTIHPPFHQCCDFCCGWWYTLSTRTTWGSGRNCPFPFVKLNFMSHSDQSQWQWEAAACWYITTEPPLPANHILPIIHPWHSAPYPSAPPPPIAELCCFLNANKAQLEHKQLNWAVLCFTIKQMFHAEANINITSWKEAIFIFLRGKKCSEPPHADTQTTAGWDDKRQETEMPLDFATNCLAVLSTN